MIQVTRLQNETDKDFFIRLCRQKDTYRLTWQEIADIINSECGYCYGADKYRKDAYKLAQEIEENEETFSEAPAPSAEEFDYLVKAKLARMQASDERVQANAIYRRLSREESIKEIAKEVAELAAQSYPLIPCGISDRGEIGDEEAILELSDWHYGINIDSPYNSYNPDIAKGRIIALRDEVIKVIKARKISHLHVVNLGDLIAGRIHLELRINSRFDVITQIINVSELLAEFLYDIVVECKGCSIDYYSTSDNHSRIEPNKKESIELESLARITDWYLKERFNDINLPIMIHKNTFGDDIVTFKSLGHNIIAVHGDKDKPSSVVERLSLMTKDYYDLCLTAHLHHFSANEVNQTVIVSNGSVMGTDAFAQRLRLSATPSQNLIISTPKCVCKEIIRIVL